ncbi:hypothetical protein LTR96_001233 [Exophiala xenobiotica]|uniref:Phosducin domain-containing protein n=1 Tax=Vermiconidia calcicola TaxID=1690605 RepID=A0AAV9QBY7_9PEZI|nr:hypothetical protein H2202_003083 [Exophiala xenobiotica]KAK5539941.1 hypothetical protein LTR25_003646 [Vermiconidia calcicola]KAK5546940.1 hypothetical protein LTR23_002943 [Chaetothyriales sp. CCFEE 6169]KAK5199864.1 hypothetical protein LTR92_000405 [Exophiala xenobiotica]KAK5211033.1 hypothetical protein LTR41_003645 [Exophiala xenobiotica]
MADLAREEADRYFSSRDHPVSHPEDRDHDSERSFEDRHDSPEDGYHSDPGTDDDDVANMATMTATRTSYHLPSQVHYANTGPKGVIADAQSFARAKQTTFRQRLASFAGNLTSHKPSGNGTEKSDKRKSRFGTSPKSNSSDSEVLALSDDEADSEFMNAWRANRVAELSSQSQSAYNSQRKQYPSQRTWGTFSEVDATGYLDAIEKVSEDTVVVVMIHDPSSSASAQVEDELSTLAYKHNKTRFILLNHEIAEMESIEIPAVLAYRGGDVFATISGARPEGLERALLQNRVL